MPQTSNFEIEWTDSGGVVQVIDFDACFDEHYEAPTEISDHAVEQGAAITDHARPGNDTFSVEAWASNTPIVSRNFGMDGAVGSTQPVSLRVGDTTVSASTFQHSQQFDRVRAIDEALLMLRDTAQLMTVRTSLRETPNCLIASYKPSRDADMGNVLAVSIDFRKIRIVSTQRVTASTIHARQRRQQGNQNRGSQPATETPRGSLLANAGVAAGLLSPP